MKKKKLIIPCLVMLLAISMNVIAANQDSGNIDIGQLIKQGDVDINGVVDKDDLVTLRKVLVGSDTEHNSSAANVNRDEKSAVDVTDLIRLKTLIPDEPAS